MLSRRTVVITTLVLAILGGSKCWAESAQVAPGTVVRWPGTGVEKCHQGGRSWQPLEGDCWFAIDLLTPPGSLQVGRRADGIYEEKTLQVASYPYEEQRITIEDDSKVDLSPDDLARVQRENGEIGKLWSLSTTRSFSLPLQAPLDDLPAGGRFGNRRFFNDQPRSPHSGADYAADMGTSVRATAQGQVALTGDFFFPGRSVFIDHGDGLVSMYFHLSRIDVTQGDSVDRGQLIGRVGQSGRATGPHLHFGIRWHRARVDPDLLLGSIESVPSVP